MIFNDDSTINHNLYKLLRNKLKARNKKEKMDAENNLKPVYRFLE